MDWHEPMSAADRKDHAANVAQKLKKSLGRELSPVQTSKKAVAQSFWGKAWCKNLETYADYEYRISRGRSYLKSGLVLDLQISKGRIEAFVCGTELYELSIDFKTLDPERWNEFKKLCAGKVASILDLLSGDLSDEIMHAVVDLDSGLFPEARDMIISCNCLDHARFCKHVSAVLHGVGVKLDASPELFFLLRQVDVSELLGSARNSIADDSATDLNDSDLSSLFGIELIDPDQQT